MESGAYYGSTVRNVYWLDREKRIDASLQNVKMQFCCNRLPLS